MKQSYIITSNFCNFFDMGFDLVLFGGTGDLAWHESIAMIARDGYCWSEES